MNLQRETRLEAGCLSCQPCQFSKNEFLSPLIVDLSHALMFSHVGESLDVGAVAQTFEGVCQYGIRRILVPFGVTLGSSALVDTRRLSGWLSHEDHAEGINELQ